MSFYIKNHRGEYIDIDDPNLKWEQPAPPHVDPNCATCGNTIMAYGVTFNIINGRSVCNKCEATGRLPESPKRDIDHYHQDDPDPAYAEYEHIKAQWANRPEAN